MVKLVLEAIEAASCGCTLQDFEALVVNTTPMIEEAMEDVMKIIRGEVKLGEKAGNMAEVAEYGTEMAVMLFQQLTPETQRKILAMCKALASGDADAAETGGAAHV